MPNRLANALSPYLRQHADNPVDWWEWSDEAFAEAKRRDVPVLLSVGYAACHWCHVMAHESFDDPAIAETLNERFVAIKVDREERPDIDDLYMRATTMLTGRGGWPMTVFLDGSGRPFHAGTYFPPTDRHGMPGFPRVLAAVDAVWRTDRPRVAALTSQLSAALADEPIPSEPVPAEAIVLSGHDPRDRWAEATGRAVDQLTAQFDAEHHGFGGAPKFPPSMVLEFLLRHHARTADHRASHMATTTLESMARGGMYDQLGGGFARYSTDATWTVPHFEKMLTDNALLARVYLHWWSASGSPLASRVTVETLDFLLDQLATPEGGFSSSLDADSEPVRPGQQREGAYYVWTAAELRGVLGEAGLSVDEVDEAVASLGVTEAGTFEAGTSVLQRRTEPGPWWPRARGALLAARALRPAPPRDDKVVLGWNGLAIAALAEASILLDSPRYLDAATSAAHLLLRVHRQDNGRWVRVSRAGRPGSAPAVLDDLADAAEGFLALYAATGDTTWFDAAVELAERAAAAHRAPDGSYWQTAEDADQLFARLRSSADNAEPSGWTAITGVMLTLGHLTGEHLWTQRAERSMAALLATGAAQQARFFGWGLAVLESMIVGPPEVVVAGTGSRAGWLHRAALAHPLRPLVVRAREGAQRPALVAGRPSLASGAAAYVCAAGTCRLPTDDPAALPGLIAAAVAGPAPGG